MTLLGVYPDVPILAVERIVVEDEGRRLQALAQAGSPAGPGRDAPDHAAGRAADGDRENAASGPLNSTGR